jgi:hypothetical protein
MGGSRTTSRELRLIVTRTNTLGRSDGSFEFFLPAVATPARVCAASTCILTAAGPKPHPSSRARILAIQIINELSVALLDGLRESRV